MSTIALAAGCGGSKSSDGGSSPSDTKQVAQTNITFAADGAPQMGGTLAYGLEAESDGYIPWKNRFAISGTVVGLAIYDPLTAFDADSNPQPYLAESLTPNDDFTSWKVTVRSGVKFHDGTPLTGDAVKRDIDKLRSDPLLGPSMANIADIQDDPSDPLSVVFTMKMAWAAFPVSLTGQGGMIAAPSTLTDTSDQPKPVGTGPFVFQSWVTDQKITTTRNPDYWRKDQNGQQLPYLDGVEFKPLPDSQSRMSTVLAGGVSMSPFNDPNRIGPLRDAAAKGDIQLVEDHGESEEAFVMLNTATEPFNNKTAREALAYATDTQTFNQTINKGILQVANNVFSPTSKFYVDTPYPTYDATKAKDLVQQYTQETGKPLAFDLGDGGTDATNRAQVELLQAQYNAVGMQVTVSPTEQSTFILDTALGNYQANVWRQFGSPDPDYDYIWWTSANANPVGSLALNFARLNDPVLDEALNTGRSSNDLAARKQAYATVQKQLNDNLAYIWLDHDLWVIAAANNVRGITNGPLPDGQPALPIGGPGGFPGTTFVTQTWLTR